jgi:apolipoprotein N-acyltransferase
MIDFNGARGIPEMKSSKLLLVIAAGMTAAALVYFGTGLHPVWPLLWFAPVPIIAIAPQLRASHVFALGTLAWFFGKTNLWKHLAYGIGLSWPLIVVSFLMPAILFALGVLFVRSFLRRSSLLLAAFAFPFYWVSYEFLTASVSPHSTYGNLAYTQMNCLPLIQTASLTGIWGISFAVFLFAGATGVLLSGAGNQQQRRMVAMATAVVLCAVFLFGASRLRSNPPARPLAVTLIAKDVPMSLYLGSEQQTLELLREYADEIGRATPAGTELIVLPEKVGRVSENVLPEVHALFNSAAAATGATSDIGLVRQTPSGAFNSSRVYSPDGAVQANYDKHHLLLGVEPEQPGNPNERVLLDLQSSRAGLQICKDMDFPQLSREYARDGANLLLVPAWDFDLDRWLHARIAVLRGVENGFAVARAGRNGLLTLSDSRGRILAEKATVPGEFVSLSGRLSVASEQNRATKSPSPVHGPRSDNAIAHCRSSRRETRSVRRLESNRAT